MIVAEEVSRILGVKVGENWDREIKNLDKAGMITKRTHLDLIILILKKLDENSAIKTPASVI